MRPPMGNPRKNIPIHELGVQITCPLADSNTEGDLTDEIEDFRQIVLDLAGPHKR